ncbi:MAG TPA: SAM-dependent methyltransferase, partial [Planctomycetaceae bacterium]|nr:SAM-dependent methyltransferase [Planctomycetaceae bacterium]
VLSRPAQLSAVEKIAVRPIDLGGERHYQWTFRRGPQEFHENLSIDELLRRVTEQFGPKFADLHWFAADGDYTARLKPGGAVKLQRKPPTKALPSVIDHNRPREHIIPDGTPVPFLIDIGVMTPDGRVKPTMSHKFRQINRYLEFVADILPQLPVTGTIHIVDFGCGKSYLTFALHHLLTAVHHRNVQLIGLDRKTEVVRHCQQIAERLGCRGLSFREGDIATFTPTGPVHLAVSLHACDTATDDALAAAVSWGCDVIFAVPCCQHELMTLLPATTLPGLTEYGLLRDRFAAMATDALRARWLECRGYHTQVVEFIELEHTPKNVLLRAVRRKSVSADDYARRLAEYAEFKRDLGVTTWHLDAHQPEV